MNASPYCIEDQLVLDSIRTPSGCWERIVRYGNGYGRIYYKGKARLAHRVSYEVFIGPIPKGLTIDHLCRNRACCNPAHLEAVTMKVNIHRGERASRTHCPQGHLLPSRRNKHGRRVCHECAKAGRRRWGKTDRGKEYMREYLQRYNEKNKDRVLALSRERQKRYRANNLEEVRKRDRERRKEQRDATNRARS